MKSNRDQAIIEIEPKTANELELAIKKNFPEMVLSKSSGYNGNEIVTLIISAGTVLFYKVLEFLYKKKSVINSAKIKMDEGGIELTGMSVDEMKDLIDSKSIEKLKKQLRK